MNEKNKNNEQQMEFRDKVNYNDLLIRAIMKVQDAQNQGLSGLVQLDQVYDILFPEIRESITKSSKELRIELDRRVSKFPKYGAGLTQEMLMMLNTPLAPLKRYFIPLFGYCVGDWMDRAKAVAYFEQQYVSIEIQNIIDELHKRNLLLITTRATEHGSLSLYAEEEANE